jgi:ABC-type polysaccharide/polyol phosphate export permease
VLCALISWKWIVSTINYSANCIKASSSILSQVYLPKYILPLQECIIQFIRFSISIGVLIVFTFFFRVPLSLHLLEVVFVAASHFLLIFSLSLFVAHFAVLIKDLKNIIVHITRVWWYLSPGIYSLNRVPDEFRWLFWLNPNTTYFESYRNVFLYGDNPHYLPLIIWTIVSLIAIQAGLKLLYKFDGSYSKML